MQAYIVFCFDFDLFRTIIDYVSSDNDSLITIFVILRPVRNVHFLLLGEERLRYRNCLRPIVLVEEQMQEMFQTSAAVTIKVHNSDLSSEIAEEICPNKAMLDTDT